MLIRYFDGTIRVGILMALTGSYVRVALKDEDDVAEYRLVSGRWISEDCEPVTFEFPLAAFQAAGIIPEAQGPELPVVGPEDAVVEPALQQLN
jgi:hypothetical protein